MTVSLNGEPHPTAADTIEALVRELELVPQTVLVEHNGTALHRREWETRRLTENDRIEILRVVAGG